MFDKVLNTPLLFYKSYLGQISRKLVEVRTKKESHWKSVYVCIYFFVCGYPHVISHTDLFPCVFHSVEIYFKYCLYFKFWGSDERFGRNIFTQLLKIWTTCACVARDNLLISTGAIKREHCLVVSIHWVYLTDFSVSMSQKLAPFQQFSF